jgi:hypothetical protein
MSKEIKIYRNQKDGMKVMEIYALDFISDRDNKLGWFGLHFRHFRIKILLKWADKVYVPDYQVAVDLVKYYFYSRENIVVDRTMLPADKA